MKKGRKKERKKETFCLLFIIILFLNTIFFIVMQIFLKWSSYALWTSSSCVVKKAWREFMIKCKVRFLIKACDAAGKFLQWWNERGRMVEAKMVQERKFINEEKYYLKSYYIWSSCCFFGGGVNAIKLVFYFTCIGRVKVLIFWDDQKVVGLNPFHCWVDVVSLVPMQGIIYVLSLILKRYCNIAILKMLQKYLHSPHNNDNQTRLL